MQHLDPRADARAEAPLLLGPGERLARLADLLERLGAALVWQRVADLGDLLGPLAGARVLLLDLDALAPEDLGLPLRALERHPELRLRLVCSDPTSSAARRLLARPGAAWLPWPLDLEQLELLSPPQPRSEAEAQGQAEEPPPPAPERSSRPAPRAAAASDEEAPLEEDLRRQVEEILGAGRPPAPPRTSPPTARPALAVAEPATRAPEEEGWAPAPWFKDQVADLADVVQRAELGHAQVRAALEGAVGGDLQERLARLGEEFARLVQFTRTLGYLVAPPGPGSQRIELGGQLESQLRSLRDDPGSPRILFRSAGETWVRSQRSLLTEAFDAFLTLAQLCTGPQGTVRVEVQPAADGARTVEVRIRFAAGPLAEMALARIQEPYGLRRVLPELGANSLAAARGILTGQGGAVELARPGADELEWRVHLPAL